MNKRPHRRKHKDNPYILEFDDSLNAYMVSFKDGRGIFQKIKVSDEIYNLLDRFELDDLSEMNEFDNHIEHSELTELTLHNRLKNKPSLLEDEILNKLYCEEVFSLLNELPELQRKRIKMYYFSNMTLDEIAKIEGTTHQAISKSINNGIRKLQKLVKNKF